MKKRILSAVLAGLLASGALSGCANPQKEGTKALEAGDYTEAEAQFQEIAESDDREKSAAGYRGLGMTYYETGDCAKALEAFQKALDMGTEQTVTLYNLMGICAMQTEDYGTAQEYIGAGLALAATGDGEDSAADPELLREMKYNQIICCEKLSDWETARQKAAEYLEEYPDDEAMQKEAQFLETR